jgi:hypothetical protein
MDLSQQKCRRHAAREAAAQCPVCGGFFCRECVTEHDDRVICSDCLLKLTGSLSPQARPLRWISRCTWGLAGFFLAWVCFYYIGQFLLSLPSDFHEGTFWTETNWKDADK